MEYKTIENLIEKFKHIEGSKDFIMLSYVSLSNKYKQSEIRRFVKAILKQDYFKQSISISEESLLSMINHWKAIHKRKSQEGKPNDREAFTFKALILMRG